MKKLTTQPWILDCIFLFSVVIFSSLPYLFDLGFYSDDWDDQATLAHCSSKGLGMMFREMVRHDSHFFIRPVQLTCLVLGFKVFGRDATAYHVANTVVLALAIVLFYLALRELQTWRWLAFLIALVYGLLPHYFTDRLFFAQQATLSMAFAFLGIYAFSKSSRLEEQKTLRWTTLAIVAFALSILSYEVALGVIIFSLGLIGRRRYLDTRALPGGFVNKSAGFLGTTGTLFLLGMIKYKINSGSNSHPLLLVLASHHFLILLAHVARQCWRASAEAVQFNLWIYGLKTPVVLFNLYQHSALTGAAVVTAIVIACLVTAYLWHFMDSSAVPSRAMCLRIIILGFILFGFGFALFFFNRDYDFSSPGLTNRVAIASAIGPACVEVSIVGLACSVLRTPVTRLRAFSLAIGAICGMNALFVGGIGFFWDDAASRQAAILSRVATDVQSLPERSVLLLDGFCRYSGPGEVFETDWDTTGAIQLTLSDPSLRGDVVSPSMSFRRSAVETTIDGEPEDRYAYGNHLFIYNEQRRILMRIPSQVAANAYLQTFNPTGDYACPPGQDDFGTKVF